jgi:dihydrofolate reductase
MRVSLIVAMAAGGVIGRENRLPWHLPADLRRFKRLTMGHPLVMGRKTYESIGRPLPGRTMVVVTRDAGYAPAGVRVAHSVDEALAIAAAAEGGEEVFVAGGAEIYHQTLPRADRIHLTRIDAEFPGDTRFPTFDESQWCLADEERHEPDNEVPFAYTFQTLDRAGAVPGPVL